VLIGLGGVIELASSGIRQPEIVVVGSQVLGLSGLWIGLVRLFPQINCFLVIGDGRVQSLLFSAVSACLAEESLYAFAKVNHTIS